MITRIIVRLVRNHPDFKGRVDMFVDDLLGICAMEHLVNNLGLIRHTSFWPSFFTRSFFRNLTQRSDLPKNTPKRSAICELVRVSIFKIFNDGIALPRN